MRRVSDHQRAVLAQEGGFSCGGSRQRLPPPQRGGGGCRREKEAVQGSQPGNPRFVWMQVDRGGRFRGVLIEGVAGARLVVMIARIILVRVVRGRFVRAKMNRLQAGVSDGARLVLFSLRARAGTHHSRADQRDQNNAGKKLASPQPHAAHDFLIG